MRTLRTLCILALVVSAWFAYFFGVKNSIHQSSLHETGAVPKGFQQPWSGLGHKRANDLHVPGKHMEESMEEDFEVFLKKVNPGNDWLFSLDPNESQSLLKNPGRVGLAVKDYLPKLGVTRFSVTNPNLAFPFFERFLKDDHISINNPLRGPLPPRDLGHPGESSFSNSFVDWMGGETERAGFGKGDKVALLDSGVNTSHPLMNGAQFRYRNMLDQ